MPKIPLETLQRIARDRRNYTEISKELGVHPVRISAQIRQAGLNKICARSGHVHRYWPAEQKDDWRKRYRSGEPTASIAKQYGVHVSTVNSAMTSDDRAEHWKNRPPPTRWCDRLTSEQFDEYIRLFRSGMSLTQLARLYGISRTACHSGVSFEDERTRSEAIKARQMRRSDDIKARQMHHSTQTYNPDLREYGISGIVSHWRRIDLTNNNNLYEILISLPRLQFLEAAE